MNVNSVTGLVEEGAMYLKYVMTTNVMNVNVNSDSVEEAMYLKNVTNVNYG